MTLNEAQRGLLRRGWRDAAPPGWIGSCGGTTHAVGRRLPVPGAMGERLAGGTSLLALRAAQTALQVDPCGLSSTWLVHIL